jgi:hypothetical protein
MVHGGFALEHLTDRRPPPAFTTVQAADGSVQSLTFMFDLTERCSLGTCVRYHASSCQRRCIHERFTPTNIRTDRRPPSFRIRYSASRNQPALGTHEHLPL